MGDSGSLSHEVMLVWPLSPSSGTFSVLHCIHESFQRSQAGFHCMLVAEQGWLLFLFGGMLSQILMW
jgi:hypothetical protein